MKMKTVQVQIPDDIERFLNSVSDDDKTFILDAVKEKLNRIKNQNVHINLSIKFNQLASGVEEDCKMVSSITQISLHPSYQEIIGMGKKVIPLLISRLDKTPNFWFNALESITGCNPIPKQDRGYLNKEKAHWNNWAKENNYV